MQFKQANIDLKEYSAKLFDPLFFSFKSKEKL